MEIVISPSAKGNAYNSTYNYTHSSDVNTFQKVFGVTASTPSGFLNDAANPSQPNADGVTGSASDLSDLFVAGTIPANLPGLSILQGGMSVNRRLGRMVQTVTITNVLNTPVTGPINLVIDNLSANTALANSTGVTVNNPPTGSPYLNVASGTLAPGASVSTTLQFAIPSSGYITYTARTVSGPANP